MDLFLTDRPPGVTKSDSIKIQTGTPPFLIIQEICLKGPSGQFFVKPGLNLTSS